MTDKFRQTSLHMDVVKRIVDRHPPISSAPDLGGLSGYVAEAVIRDRMGNVQITSAPQVIMANSGDTITITHTVTLS